MRKILAGLLLVICSGAYGAEVAGVKIAESAKSGTTELVLSGAGLRSKFVFKVYALGLYLPAKKTAAAEVLSSPGPKRILIHMLRDVDAAEFAAALEEGVKANHSEAEVKALAPRLSILMSLMKEIKEAKTGMVILLDWLPDAGTQVTIENQPHGKLIPGEDFYRALLRIWLGDNPVQADLKKALLGQGG